MIICSVEIYSRIRHLHPPSAHMLGLFSTDLPSLLLDGRYRSTVATPHAYSPGLLVIRASSGAGAPASTEAWLTPSLIIAICALTFTVLSFWWLNARRGRLKSFEPHTFAAYITPDKVRLRLPFVLHNTGAVPIVVQNLRIRFSTEQYATPLPWVATRDQIKPDNGERHAFPAVFSVGGRTADQIFVEFGAPSLGFTLEASDYPVQIEAKLGHWKEWQFIVGFTFRAWHINDPTRFITYENTPASLTEEQHARVEMALRAAQADQKPNT